MAHNRPIVMVESSLSRSVKGLANTTPETRVLYDEIGEMGNASYVGSEAQELLHEASMSMTRYNDLRERESSHDRVTITLQQLSVGAAVVLCVSFFIFLIGYGMGRYQAFRSTVQTGTTVQISGIWDALCNSTLNGTEAYRGTQHEYGRAASQEEAEKISQELSARGLAVTIRKQMSHSSQGNIKEWFRVLGTKATEK